MVTGVGDAGRSLAIRRVGDPLGPYVGGIVMERELAGHGWMPDAGARLHVARVLTEAGRQALQRAADQWGTGIAEADYNQRDDAAAWSGTWSTWPRSCTASASRRTPSRRSRSQALFDALQGSLIPFI